MSVARNKEREKMQMKIKHDFIPIMEEYNNIYGKQLLIEGPEDDNDLSYPLVYACKEIKNLEKGINFDPIILLE